MLLQTRCIKIAPMLPEAQTPVREVQTFQVKVTTADDDAAS